MILYTDGLLTCNETHSIDIDQFSPYLYQENAYALQHFAQDHDLFENYYDDDITIVSITITL